MYISDRLAVIGTRIFFLSLKPGPKFWTTDTQPYPKAIFFSESNHFFPRLQTSLPIT